MKLKHCCRLFGTAGAIRMIMCVLVMVALLAIGVDVMALAVMFWPVQFAAGVGAIALFAVAIYPPQGGEVMQVHDIYPNVPY